MYSLQGYLVEHLLGPWLGGRCPGIQGGMRKARLCNLVEETQQNVDEYIIPYSAKK